MHAAGGIALALLAWLPLHRLVATTADCDAARTSRPLQPAAGTRSDARAYRLHVFALRWPGKPDGRFALAWSSTAAAVSPCRATLPSSSSTEP